MSLPERIEQPGPVARERILAVPARGSAFSFTLPAGVTLLEGVRRGFAAAGFDGGVVEFGAMALEPFAYVMPALSETGENAAFYSAPFHPGGRSVTRHGALTFGERDGAPFFHCHALWDEADGRLTGGHMLPEGTVVAEDVIVTAFGVNGAGFRAQLDPETNFKLFEPVSLPSPGSGENACFAMRLRPNQDFAGALEAFCRARGIQRAHLRGGVGSTIGARFEDGSVAENFATEIYLREASIDLSPGGAGVVLPIGLVDYTGHVAEGRLLPGRNPVLMTLEVVLVVDAMAGAVQGEPS